MAFEATRVPKSWILAPYLFEPLYIRMCLGWSPPMRQAVKALLTID